MQELPFNIKIRKFVLFYFSPSLVLIFARLQWEKCSLTRAVPEYMEDDVYNNRNVNIELIVIIQLIFRFYVHDTSQLPHSDERQIDIQYNPILKNSTGEVEGSFDLIFLTYGFRYEGAMLTKKLTITYTQKHDYFSLLNFYKIRKVDLPNIQLPTFCLCRA